MIRKKMGRPKGSHSPLPTITFRVDEATQAAIEELVAACPAGTLAPQSTVIRTSIIEAAARLKAG